MQKKPKLVEGNFNKALLLFFFAALDDFSVPQRNTKVIRNLDFWHPIRQLLFVVFYGILIKLALLGILTLWFDRGYNFPHVVIVVLLTAWLLIWFSYRNKKTNGFSGLCGCYHFNSIKIGISTSTAACGKWVSYIIFSWKIAEECLNS